VVIGMPHFVGEKKLIKESGLKLIYTFSNYIHKSLSKKIIVLEKN